MTLYKLLDKAEDYVRASLSRTPIIYGIVGGTAIVMFWRGIWHSADLLEEAGAPWSFLFNAPVSTIIAALVLLLTGLFVSFFIGDRIILSGLMREKKIEEKTESEVRAEGALIVEMYKKIEQIEKEIAQLKEKK